MSENPRLTKLKQFVEQNPDDLKARYFLAHELFKVEDWAGAASHYQAYVDKESGDAGAALKSLGLCHERLGDAPAAARAYRMGIERALAFGHEGLAGEIRFLLNDLPP